MATVEVLSTRIEDGIAVIVLGSPKRIFFDAEMSDALLEKLSAFTDDARPAVRPVLAPRVRDNPTKRKAFPTAVGQICGTDVL
jgi:hypothetical protein